ncbi:ECF transporter S component [Rugosimonospora africana]|uniref:ABC transporter permease n=1 Tax=Rugosimonospora africana TaxID=556532 RepID=A0A8J3R391_9ACTN|nr:ECF transporter S component [Rugosimonospora africana]GIH20585.1 ABC transporter permease [Rugosimonospora africana]
MDNRRWRTVDIVVAAVIAVAFGVVFYAWDQLWNGLENAFPGFPPLRAVLNGVWFLPAVVGPLVIRKPGAGLFTEAVASTIEALLGAKWGLATILYGLMQGFGGEIPFAATGYRTSKLPTALVGGLLAGAAAGLLDVVLYYPTWSGAWQIGQVAVSAASGMVITGLGGWALTRGLAQTGVLDRFPAGRERAAV